MKKLHLLSRLLLLVALVAGSTSVRAEEVVFDIAANPWGHALGSGSGATADVGNITEPIVEKDVILAFDKGKASTNPRFWTGPQIRVYSGNTFSLTAPESKTITKIEITLANSGTFTTEPEGLTGNTWEGNAKNIIFTVTANAYMTKIIVTLDSSSGGGETTDPGTEPEIKGYYKKITSTDELEDGQYLIVNETAGVAYRASDPADANNNVISVTIGNNIIDVSETTAANEFIIDISSGSIKAASGKYIGRTTAKTTGITLSDNEQSHVISITDGNADITCIGNDNTIMYLRYNGTGDQNRFRYYAGTSVQSIQLYKYVETVDVKVSGAGWATWVAPRNVKFAEGEAYTVKVEGDVANLTNVTEIPANTAVVLKGEQGTEVTVTATVTKDEVVLETANDLKASDGEVVGNGKIYVLANKNDQVGFYLLQEESTLPSGKAYLELESNQEVRSFIGLNDNETTGINTTLMNNEAKNKEFYNLAGQRVAQPTKGLYIVNGKKLIIK